MTSRFQPVSPRIGAQAAMSRQELLKPAFGVSDQDSRAVLAKLTDHATRREIVYQHQWQVGDLVIWDNCGTMHRVIPYEASSGRMMHRTTLHGVEAIG